MKKTITKTVIGLLALFLFVFVCVTIGHILLLLLIGYAFGVFIEDTISILRGDEDV